MYVQKKLVKFSIQLFSIIVLGLSMNTFVFAGLSVKSGLTIAQGIGGFAQPAAGTGSWFAMEALGPGGWVYTGIGGITNGKLKLDGTAQFSRAAGVAPQLTEVAGIDNNWTFFGSSGVHGSNGLTAQPGNTVNMSGWYVSWNNVANIDMGQGAVATVTCSDANACGNGATYALDYAANVPTSSANFPGVAYKLHLEGTVFDLNQAPIIKPGTGSNPLITSVTPNGTVTIDLAANVTDPDGDGVDNTSFVISNVSSRAPIITSIGNGVFTYQDTAGTPTTTPDTFTYTVKDNLGKVSNSFTVNVNVVVGNLPPIASPFAINTNKDTAVPADVVAHTVDNDGTVDATTVVTSNLVPRGSTTVDPGTGIVTFTPANGFTGTASFDYTVKDNSGAISNVATVTVNVNAPPVAVNDSASVNRNSSVAIDVTANDTDSDGTIDKTTVVATNGAKGTTSVDPTTGVVTYTPTTASITTDTFTYTVKDDKGLVSNTATVTVNINDAPPVANDDTGSIDIGSSSNIVINVTTNDTDPDGMVDVATVTIGTQPAHGSASADTLGKVTYTPDGSQFIGSDTFTYTVSDNNAVVSNIATVTVSVSNSNAAVLPINATLTIKSATIVNNAAPTEGSGSWFNMEVSPGALTFVAIQGFNQLQLGTVQLGALTAPNIDVPWLFFGNQGIHQTTSKVTVLSDDGHGNITLDFSGWNVAWNNISSIPLNARAHTAGFVDSIAIMTCANDCSIGDTYKLEYSATVPNGDPSGFGNVKYFLHLEGVVSAGKPTYGGGNKIAPHNIDVAVAKTKDANGVTVTLPVKPGSTADAVGNTTGMNLTPADIGIKDPLLNEKDGEECVGGCLDFTVTGVSSDHVDFVFKLNKPMPKGAIFRKLLNGVWGDFDESKGGQIASAKSINGKCQGPDGVFDIGLREGNDCLFMRIIDNGPNDADATKGVIADPSGVLSKGSSNIPPGATSGCSISATPVAIQDRADWLIVGIFLSVLGFMRIRRKPDDVK